MTTLSLQSELRPSKPNGADPSFGGALRSEWIKLRSLRSTVWSYAIVIAISLGMAALVAFALTTMPEGSAAIDATDGTAGSVVQASLAGVLFAQLVAGVLGVLVISGEYTTGMIRSTFAAIPTRLPALAAKAVVLFAATFLVGIVANLAGYVAASLVFAGEGISAPLAEPAVFWPILGAAVWLAMVALFALGVGAVVRSSAGGIAAVLGVLLLLPIVLQLIPAEWAQDLVPYLFSTAGSGIYSSSSLESVGDAFGVWANLLVAGIWVTVSLTAAAVLMRRRDA
ncbi:ABC transporter permease subunit [Microbacterium sp. NPDC057407]|uniref:ABC transporter permease subunit n=1 Tax=Microbacterium sp. NPDC057407 TaxID=3346120 RepID=UPI00366C2E5B